MKWSLMWIFRYGFWWDWVVNEYACWRVRCSWKNNICITADGAACYLRPQLKFPSVTEAWRRFSWSVDLIEIWILGWHYDNFRFIQLNVCSDLPVDRRSLIIDVDAGLQVYSAVSQCYASRNKKIKIFFCLFHTGGCFFNQVNSSICWFFAFPLSGGSVDVNMAEQSSHVVWRLNGALDDKCAPR